MVRQRGPKKDKEFIAEKSHIKTDMIGKIFFSLGLAIFLFAASIDFEWNAIGSSEVLMTIFISGVIFMLFALSSNIIKNYRVLINDEYIKFKHFIKFVEHDEYKWEDISIIIIGDVVIKNSRFNQTVFGAEVFYKDNYYKKLTSDVHKLDHLTNYEQLISEIIDKCNEYNIKCEDTR